MTELELVRKALESVTAETFPCHLYASEGGTCCDGWCDDSEMDLDREEVLYLISCRVNNDEYFKGMTLKEVDPEEIISEMAEEGAWPDGGPHASVNSCIPQELESLAERIGSYDDAEPEDKKAIRDEILDIVEGDYTFSFSVIDGSTGYDFTDDAKVEIYLTAEEIQRLFLGEYPNKKLFRGICTKPLGEEFLDDKAIKLGVADKYNSFSYGGDSEYLDNYLSSWETIIDNINSGEITEENLGTWLEYFEDPDNYENDVEGWMSWHSD